MDCTSQQDNKRSYLQRHNQQPEVYIYIFNISELFLAFRTTTTTCFKLTKSLSRSSPNTDGINIDCSQQVLVEDCIIDTGDDALCVKSGINWYVWSPFVSCSNFFLLYLHFQLIPSSELRLGYTYGQVSEDIIFRNIKVYHAHGITIGSEMSGGVRNVLFERIQMKGADVGIRIKSQRGRGGFVENITYRDIDMDGVSTAIQVTMNYNHGLTPTNATATPVFRDILVQNVRALDSRTAFDIQGLEESLIHNLTLANVFVDADSEGRCESVLLHCVDSECPGSSSFGQRRLLPVLFFVGVCVAFALFIFSFRKEYCTNKFVYTYFFFVFASSFLKNILVVTY